MKILLSIVLLTISSASYAQTATECYTMATERESDGGLVVEEYNRGRALKLNKYEALMLCRGTKVAKAPVTCALMAQERKKMNGLDLNQTEAIKLCAGTNNVETTKNCFVKATNHERDGGLDLNEHEAIMLCKKM